MAFAPILMIAGAVLSAAAAVQQGMAAKAAGDANNKMMKSQAAIAEQQGVIRQRRTQLEGQQFKGRQMGAYAGAGIDLGLGSPLDAVSETTKEYEWRANLARWEAQAQATSLRNQGALSAWEGQQRQMASFGQAAGSLFKGVAGAYDAGLFSSTGGGGSGGNLATIQHVSSRPLPEYN